MKNGFRILLLIIVMFALYGGFTTQIWSYPIGIMALCFLCFLGTLKKTGKTNISTTSQASKNGDITPIIVASGVASNTSSSNSSSGSGGGGGGC
ncbi:hypothetical protein CJF42_05735 [Pseudoalteromonas sp. NBT06-2]|uniref:hypothetical protein n=1 Tax=Pseudoalteromonas sp. NBT06-2 TaxID=2025950 RepID=UPI000BA5CA5B|nr:hypothetical protein [Pseudoalteromonas sp. NBT06-2]PAJ75343.1 hypothetical protein CJF42_05735 [Pseudoalteromonas sp. NBT06-2]